MQQTQAKLDEKENEFRKKEEYTTQLELEQQAMNRRYDNEKTRSDML